MIYLILWVLVGLVATAIDIYLCKLDKEKQTVKSLTKGTLSSVIFAPLAICYILYLCYKRTSMPKLLRDFWNKEIL